jgi:hypothetical protein
MMNIQRLLHAVISEAADKTLGPSPDCVAGIVGNGSMRGLWDQGFDAEAAIVECQSREGSDPADEIDRLQ